MIDKLLRWDCAFLLALAPIAILLASTPPASAEQIVLRNDLASDGQPGSIWPYMWQGDMGLSWFSLPPGYDLAEIKQVHVGLATQDAWYPNYNTFGEFGVAFGDWDLDTDVDDLDISDFQACLVSQEDNCFRFDGNFDGAVDQDDFERLLLCYSGDGVPADPDCGNLDERGYLLAPPSKALGSVMDVLLYCGNTGNLVGYMGGVTLQPNALNVLPITDYDLGMRPEVVPTGKKWIVNRENGLFGIGVQYRRTVDPDATTLSEAPAEPPFTPYSAHLAMDVTGCVRGLNFIYLWDPEYGYLDRGDLCDTNAPGNFIIRVLIEATPSITHFGDADGDLDVDSVDFAALQRCYGTQWPAHQPNPCDAFDCDHNFTVGETDLATFLSCSTGPGVVGNPDCATCFPPGLCELSALAKSAVAKTGMLVQNAIAHSLRMDAASEEPPKAIPALLVYLIIGAILLGLAIWGGTCIYNHTQLLSKQQKFRDAGICMNPRQTQLVREAILLLRDTWAYEDKSTTNSRAQKDPLAKKCGKELWDGKYYDSQECNVLVVRKEDNPTNIMAVQPVQTKKIIIDESKFTTKEEVATVLYAEWLHIWNKGGKYGPDGEWISTEGECQRQLEAFFERHGKHSDIKHGGENEGVAK